eukprot:Sdes_comp17358_c1_seq1m6563
MPGRFDLLILQLLLLLLCISTVYPSNSVVSSGKVESTSLKFKKFPYPSKIQIPSKTPDDFMSQFLEESNFLIYERYIRPTPNREAYDGDLFVEGKLLEKFEKNRLLHEPQKPAPPKPSGILQAGNPYLTSYLTTAQVGSP